MSTTPPLEPQADPVFPAVLVVEDQVLVRGLIKKVLEARGYHALAAEDGQSGLSAFWEYHADLRAVVADFSMEGMNGLAMVREMQDLDRSVPIIVASGALDDDLIAEFRALNVAAILMKPFTARQLMNTLDTVLQHPNPLPAQATTPPAPAKS